jgi:glc operon protein GlcG
VNDYLRPCVVLTYAGARVALDAALERAGPIGGAFNIAVTDWAGVLLAFARMDGAFAHSSAIAIDKAATVAGFGGLASDDRYSAIAGFGGLASDDRYSAIVEDPAARDGIVRRPGMAAFAGGVLVVIDGQFAGAVGVSGGSADQDKDVASAGAAAVGHPR